MKVETIIYKKDNNLDELDNLDELPQLPAVYAICGRINGKASNCRHVGITENLQKAIKLHFSNDEADECLKTFMQSIKIKALIYELLNEPDESYLHDWKEEFKPDCNEELNKVH